MTIRNPQSPTGEAVLRRGWILPTIVFSQFAGTSLWFATNAVITSLFKSGAMPADAIGLTTSAVQAGFILGTLLFAFFTVADRYSPRKIFLLCSLLGALFNVMIALTAGNLSALLAFRFLVGLTLAGIYPVGMKVASGWYKERLGSALGFLVGALVVGTAFPHLVRATNAAGEWQIVIYCSSGLAVLGGILMAMLVGDGPYLVKGNSFNPRALAEIFHVRELRESVFGYFGHMWELYTFYAFAPVFIAAYLHETGATVSFWSFAAIAAGGMGCAGGGLLSRRIGNAKVAFAQLCTSGICCLLLPMVFNASPAVFFSFMLIWGFTVAGDSPQYSTMTARFAPRELVGSALAITISIGFAITVVSIALVTRLAAYIAPQYLPLALVPGPVFGLLSLSPLLKRSPL